MPDPYFPTRLVLSSLLSQAPPDLLQVNLSTPNTINNLSRFPNGRRIQDQPVDFFLMFLNDFEPINDNIDPNELPPVLTFPFLHPPHQPLFSNAVDDRTRN